MRSWIKKTLLGSILVTGLTVGIIRNFDWSSPAVASYTAFMSPKVRITKHVDPADRDRFKVREPKNQPGKIARLRNSEVKYLKPNYPIWLSPYVSYVSTTNGLADHSQAVEPIERVNFGRQAFYKVKSAGYVYGWVPRQALRNMKIYRLPFRYYSQLSPVRAQDACEAVSLRMALSVKGRDPRISMRKFIDRIPRSSNPEFGYTASPYRYGDKASIYPQALAKYGRRYDKRTKAYTGISKQKIISELKHGNPVVYEGSYRMHTPNSDHTLVLVGYMHDSDNNQGYFQFADPFYAGKSESKPISWVSVKKFGEIFNSDLRKSRAVVVY